MLFVNLAGPVVSADDLKTLARSSRFAGVPAPERNLLIVHQTLDAFRFPWVAEGRPPRSEERQQALRSTAGLWATETVRTRRRVRESREQEEAVIAIAQDAGFEAAAVQRRRGRPGIERPEEIPIGQYTQEINIAGQKCDVPIRLRDGRLLAVECKVSNSEVNSYKRLQRETCGKARQWERDFGRHGILTAAVLRGVFSPTNVIDAQDHYGVAIFWEHNLIPLSEFLSAAA